MKKFDELYQADIARYGGKPELYIKIFLYLYRKAIVTDFKPVKLFYKALFRLWANRRGLEISAINQIGGVSIQDMPIILQSIQKHESDVTAISTKVWLQVRQIEERTKVDLNSQQVTVNEDGEVIDLNVKPDATVEEIFEVKLQAFKLKKKEQKEINKINIEYLKRAAEELA